MELYVFDRELNFKGILEDYFSLRWVRRYSKHGEFELHCNFNTEMIALLQKDDIIWKNDDEEAGYIVYRELMQNIEGKEILVLKGKFLTHYLDRRIIWERVSVTDTVENIMRQLIVNNAINPAEIDRKIDLLELEGLKNFINNISYQVSYKNLLEEVEALAHEYGYGIRSIPDFDSKNIKFDIYKGIDRTADQNINAAAIFSKEYENILEQEYIESIDNYRSIALIAGEGQGNDRKIEIVGTGIALDRYELYVDARDLQANKMVNDEYVPIPENEYREMLVTRGKKKLSETGKIETFNSSIDLDSNLIYKDDFDLGDIVTCTSKRWGITIDTRITEVEEIYEESGQNINVVFGNNIPGLIDKIRQVVN